VSGPDTFYRQTSFEPTTRVNKSAIALASGAILPYSDAPEIRPLKMMDDEDLAELLEFRRDCALLIRRSDSGFKASSTAEYVTVP